MALLPITSFLTEYAINKLASRSHLRYGKQMVKDDSIAITKKNLFNIVAEVDYKTKQTVTFSSTSKGFRFKCSCSNKKDFFCEHCTAVALFISPKKEA